MPPTATRNMPCPECRKRTGQEVNMGNARAECKTCNRFAQKVRNTTLRLLRDRHSQDYDAIRESVEDDIYREFVA